MKLGVVLAAAVGTCGTPGPSPTPPASDHPDPAAVPEPPVDEGEPLDATIPLLSGETTELAALRGSVVILEVSATDQPGWAQAHAHFRGLVEQVHVVAVSTDAVAERIQEDWDRDAPPFVLGWDPQGALALRLGVKQLPTTFVLDPQGRIVGAAVGWDAATLDTIDRLVASAKDPGRSGPGPAAR